MIESIKTVDEYLRILNTVTNINDDYFYRGENQDFGDTKLTATLYRRGPLKSDCSRGDTSESSKGVYEYNTWKTYLDAAYSFYKNVPNLTNNEKQNFMALCQHHSLPTPLLDVSTSPLIALYFASQPIKNKINDDYGRVYIFKKDNFILFDNHILSYKYLMKCRKGDQTYALLSLKTNESIRKSYDSIRDLEVNANNRQNNYLNFLISRILKKLNSNSSKFRNDKYCLDISNCLKNIKNPFMLYGSIRNTVNGLSTNHPTPLVMAYIHFLNIFGIRPTSYSYLNTNNGVKNVMYHYIDKDGNAIDSASNKLVNYSLLLLFLIYLSNYVLNDTKFFIPKELNFCTNCTLNWGRIRAQKSYFIIQSPYTFDGKNFNHFRSKDDLPNDSVYIPSLSIVHKPEPMYVINIKNKSSIRRKLDSMGINKMSLFMDKDSIADYFKKKYYV